MDFIQHAWRTRKLEIHVGGNVVSQDLNPLA